MFEVSFLLVLLVGQFQSSQFASYFLMTRLCLLILFYLLGVLLKLRLQVTNLDVGILVPLFFVLLAFDGLSQSSHSLLFQPSMHLSHI